MSVPTTDSAGWPRPDRPAGRRLSILAFVCVLSLPIWIPQCNFPVAEWPTDTTWYRWPRIHTHGPWPMAHGPVFTPMVHGPWPMATFFAATRLLFVFYSSKNFAFGRSSNTGVHLLRVFLMFFSVLMSLKVFFWGVLDGVRCETWSLAGKWWKKSGKMWSLFRYVGLRWINWQEKTGGGGTLALSTQAHVRGQCGANEVYRKLQSQH